MADKNLALQLIIRAKDEATSLFSKVFTALNDTTNVIAGKVRDAFTGIFGGALSGAMEFEAQLSKVQAKGQFTAATMGELRQVAIDVGAKFGISGTEAAQGMESLAAAGLNAQQIMQTLPSVLALARIEGLSMDAASEKLANSLTAVGLEFDQAGRMADVLAQGAIASTTSASALAEALSTSGQIANSSGLIFEKTAAVLTALAKGGIEGEKAGTSLAAILTQLQNPASTASIALDKLGISSRDLFTVIGQLATEGAAANTAILAFGETAGPGLRALISQGKSGLDELTATMLDAKGAAQQASDTMSDNLQTALGALGAAWSQVKTSLLEPALKPLAEGAREAAKALNDTLASGALKPVQEAIRSFATNAVQTAKEFTKGFQFKDAETALNTLATTAKSAFDTVGEYGKNSANVVSLAYNALASGFRAIYSAIAAIAAGAVQTLSEIESVASKIGLGTQERANSLAQTAKDIAQSAETTLAGVTNNAEKIKSAFDGLTATTKATGTAVDDAATKQARLKQEMANAADAVGKTREALIAANEEYRNAQARGEDLTAALAALKQRTDEHVAALNAQQTAQQAMTGKMQEAQPAIAAVADSTQKTTEALAALPAPATEAAARIAEVTKGTQDGVAVQKEYVDGANYLVKGFADAAQGAKNAAQGHGELNKALLDTAGATDAAQAKTTKLTEEINRVSEASATWRQGKELNIVVLNSLQNTLESTQAKLVLLEERQRAGEQVDNEIVETKAAVQQAYNRLSSAIEENVTQQERAVDAAQRAAQLGQQEADINVQRAQSLLDLAKIRGDDNAAAQAENDLTDATIAKGQNAVAAKEQEIAAYAALIEATQRKLAFDGELDASDKNQLAVMADKLKALELEKQAMQESITATAEKARAERDAADAAKAAAQAAKDAADAAKAAAEEQKHLGDAISTTLGNAQHVIRNLGGDTEKLVARFNELQSIMLSAVNAQGMVGWMNQIAAVTREVTQEYTSQKDRLDSLTETLTHFAETGEMNATVQQALIQSTGDLTQRYTILNQQDLSNLRAALDSANAKLAKMKQETEDAKTRLAELNAELLSAEGEDTKAKLLEQQLDYQKQLAEIKAQIAEAEASGNRELLATLNEQLAVLEKINDAKVRNIAADTTGGDTATRITTAWTEAGTAIKSAGAALNEVYTAADKISRVSLLDLHQQITGVTEQAGKLASVL